MSGLLAGRRVLVTGVLTDASLAYAVARLAQEQGAEVVLTSFGRALRITERVARRLPTAPAVLELDLTSASDLGSLQARLEGLGWDRVDGVLHAAGFAPATALGGGFLDTPWTYVAVALQVSTWSLVGLVKAVLPLLPPGAAVVGLDFDASRAWPSYDWMGVAKAGLESCCRYLARDLGPRGVRVNLVAAGPLRTIAATSVPSFDQLAATWGERAPLGWDTRNAEPVAQACVALLSAWFPATTGSIVFVDGGVHAVG